MADLTVDPVVLEMASKKCNELAGQINTNIKAIQEALARAANWKGATSNAVIMQFQEQRPLLIQLQGLLGGGGDTMKNASFGFSDHDQSGASGVGGASAHAASNGGAPSALTGQPLNT